MLCILVLRGKCIANLGNRGVKIFETRLELDGTLIEGLIGGSWVMARILQRWVCRSMFRGVFSVVFERI